MSKRGVSVVRWREIVRGQAESGLSVAAYCRRAGVAQSSFFAWRRKLRGAGTFAEVRVTPDGAAELGAGPSGAARVAAANDPAALELHLRPGRRVSVRPGFDRQTLLDLIAALEASCRDGVAAEVGE